MSPVLASLAGARGRTQVCVAAAAVRVVQVAVLLRQLPEGCLAVAELHGAHAAAAAHLGRVHALRQASPGLTDCDDEASHPPSHHSRSYCLSHS